MSTKNVIVVVADAMCDYFIDGIIGDEYICPFIHGLAENNIRAISMYSQAPYTMAAIQALLSGKNTLDVEDYSVVLNNDNDLIFDVFAENDYQVFTTEYGSFIPSKKTIDFGEHYLMEINGSMKFMEPFIIHYIHRIKEDNPRKEFYYHRLANCVKKAFEGASASFSDKSGDDCKLNYFSEIKMPTESQKRIFEEEFAQFTSNSNEYLESLIETEKKHSFFKIDDSLKVSFSNEEDLDRFYKKHNKELKLIRIKEWFINVFNRELPIFDMIKWLSLKPFGREIDDSRIVNFLQRIRLGSLSLDEYSDSNYRTHGIPSAWVQLDSIEKMMQERKDKGKPFFSYIHVMDTHQPFNFFTGEDIDLAEEEMQSVLALARGVNKRNYKGSISQLMSARYIDICMERFVKKLNKEGLLENTIMVFTSDHGLLYGNSPLRSHVQGDNYNYESYHVPFIIVDYSNQEKKQIDATVSSIDFLPTICNRAGIDKRDDWRGYDLMSENHRGYALIEWMGTGAPDIYEKPIIYGARDNKYYVVVKAKLEESVESNKIEAIYDLIADPFEKHNIKKKVNANVLRLLQVIRDRHKEIQNKYNIKETL